MPHKALVALVITIAILTGLGLAFELWHRPAAASHSVPAPILAAARPATPLPVPQLTNPSASLTANNNFTGANTFKSFENIRFVGSGGGEFTTIEAAQTDILNSGALGGIVWVKSGFRETFTSTITLGTNTQSILLWLMPDVVLTCNVTSGDCIDTAPASGIRGHNVGTLGGSRTSGAAILLASSATVTNIIGQTSSICTSGSVGNYVTLDDFWIQGQGGGTATNDLDICTINNMGQISNIFILPGGNQTGVKIENNSGGSGGTGPLSLENVTVDCTFLTGCHPAKIAFNTAAGTSTYAIDWNGGYINHPGTGIANLELAGGAGTLPFNLGNIRFRGYIEGGGTNDVGIKIVDTTGVHLDSVYMRLKGSGATAVDISQSGAGKTSSIQISNMVVDWTVAGGAGTGTLINDHISGRTFTGNYVPHHNFGGDSTAAPLPFTIEANALAIGDTTSDTLPPVGSLRMPRRGLFVLENEAQTGNVQISKDSNDSFLTQSWAGFRLNESTSCPASGGTGFNLLCPDGSDHFIHYNPNNQGDQRLPQTFNLTSQYTNSTTSFTNVAGGNTIQWAVKANTTYLATCHLYYQAAATGGLNIEFTGPASPTSVIYGLSLPIILGTANNSVATAYSTSLGTAVTTSGTNFDASVSFALQNGANAGTVNLLAKSSAAAQLQIQSGSFCVVQ